MAVLIDGHVQFLIPEVNLITWSYIMAHSSQYNPRIETFHCFKLCPKCNRMYIEHKLSRASHEVDPSGISGMPRSDGCGEKIEQPRLQNLPFEFNGILYRLILHLTYTRMYDREERHPDSPLTAFKTQNNRNPCKEHMAASNAGTPLMFTHSSYIRTL